MKKEKIKVVDTSGDKKYFTIVPNYILNHSTLWDREVYIQMKRIAGENGTCWTSQKILSKQCGISVNRLKKSLKYLTERRWIVLIGTKEILTTGGAQEVNEYRISDLWKLNIDFYEAKGVSCQDTPEGQRGITAEAKGVSPEGYKEEPVIKKNTLLATQALQIRDTIDLFKNINPSYKLLFNNKTERGSVERLLNKYGKEKVERMVKFAESVIGEPFAPVITTPYQLEKNLGKLIAFYQRRKSRKPLLIEI